MIDSKNTVDEKFDVTRRIIVWKGVDINYLCGGYVSSRGREL